VSALPTDEEMVLLQERIAGRLGCRPGIRDADLLRAVLLGVRLSRRGREVHRGAYERAAAMMQQLVIGGPFVSANEATALAGALLYLSRHGWNIDLGPGQAASIIEGLRNETLDEKRLASLFRLRTENREPSQPVAVGR
jgi:prophage maintenance system killer protein